jgi:hypothetical protein
MRAVSLRESRVLVGNIEKMLLSEQEDKQALYVSSVAGVEGS